jgi:serine/threonine-protein kinase ATR
MMSAYASRNSRILQIPANFDPMKEKLQVSRVELILAAIPPRIMATRAMDCKSFSRAIFHHEEDIRQYAPEDIESQLKQLQTIYEQIDEPDAIEGISTRLLVIDLSQQVLDHKRSGRWTAALSWYEIAAEEKPDDIQLQIDFLSCLKASSQYDSLINTVQRYENRNSAFYSTMVPLAAEAAWMTGKFNVLKRLMQNNSDWKSQDFNSGVARALLALRDNDQNNFNSEISDMRASLSRSFSPSTTISLSNAHPHLLKLHVLYELDMLSGLNENLYSEVEIMRCLDRRLDIIGSFTEDKQYVLGIRRAVMEISRYVKFSP